MMPRAKHPAAVPTKPQRMTRTTVDTIMFTREQAKGWIVDHEIQRELSVNRKVLELADWLRDNKGVIPGVIKLAVVGGDTYLLDGQHRIAAFMLSGLNDGYADVVTQYFDSLAELGPAFVQQNMQLVRLRSDDVLRAHAKGSPQLTRIMRACSCVTFDQIRRTSDRVGCVSMSTVLRSWKASQAHTPISPRFNAIEMAEKLTDIDAEAVIGFLEECDAAWGRDVAASRLWSELNLTLCMWLYRRVVLTRYSPRVKLLTRGQFRDCLIAASTTRLYVEWLKGRNMGDRSAGYSRLKMIFAKRLGELLAGAVVLPQPEWAA
jgi:hypothetical protein